MSNSKKITGCILLAISLLIGYMICDIYREHGVKLQLNKKIKTEATFVLIAEGILEISRVDAEHPVSKDRIIDWVIANGYDDPIAIRNNEQIIDAWDMPILIRQENKAIYKLISCGPNQQDDQGEGDDVTRSYDLSGDEVKSIDQ